MNQHHRKGLLLVVSGPAGVGKGTIDRVLLERNTNMRLSVSATTRAPRPGEIDGVHYFFISDDKFKEMVENNEFLEYMHVFNLHYYGTPRSFVEEEIAMGHDVLLEIDVQGAMRVREAYPGAVLVFIAPPSMGKLKSRLVGRGTETPEVIERRFQTAFSELEYMKKYDYIVVNDVLDVAISHMEHIIDAEKCRSERNDELVNKLLGGNN
ncbi:MAG: guanylate kinase [bacterium]|nr:guanylate kinase [bacterium]